MPVAFTIQRAALLPLADAARKAVKKSKMPILNNLLITAEADAIEVMGTDLVMTVAGTATAEIAQEGQASIDAEMFLNTLRRMPEGPIRIEEGSGRMTIKGGKASGKLHSMLAEDHARIDRFETKTAFEIQSSDIGRIVENCTFAMSTNEVRHYLCGTFMHVHDGELRAVATDGTVFSKLAFEMPASAAALEDIIIPDVMVRALPLLVGKKAAAVKVEIGDGDIAFRTDDLRMASRLVEGQFPSYMRFVPRPAENGITVATEAFRGAVDRMLLYAPDGEHRYRDVKCVFGADSVQMLTRSDKGEASDEIEVTGGRDVTVGWNSRRLLDLLATIKGETIRLEPGGPGDPTRIVDVDDAGRELVIMPITLKW